MTCSSCFFYRVGYCRLWRVDRSPDREVCDEFKDALDMRTFDQVARAAGWRVEEKTVRVEGTC